MPITVDYGPIGIAMGLATQGGQNLATQTNNQNDLSLLGYAQRAQAMNNQQRATEMQQAMSEQGLGLEADRNVAQQQLAQAQLAATTGYHNASLAGLNSYRQGRNDIGQQNADTNADKVDNQADYNNGRLDVGQQNADTRSQGVQNTGVFQQGMLGINQQNANTRQSAMTNQNQNASDANDIRQQGTDTQQLQGEFQSLASVVKQHENSLGDPNDPQYLAAKARMNEIMQSMQQRYRASDMPQVQSPARVQAAPQQQQQSDQQPGSTPATAVTISGSADFQQLPSGTYYTGPDGVLRQKP